MIGAVHAALISLFVISLTILITTPLGRTCFDSLNASSTSMPLTVLPPARYSPLLATTTQHAPSIHTKPLPKFVMKQEEYAGAQEDPLDKMPFVAYDTVPPRLPGMVVPNVFHYIWLDQHDNLYLTYSQYLAMRSVIMRQKPFKLFM